MEFKGTPAPWLVEDNRTYFEIRAVNHYSHLADICGSQITYDDGIHSKDGVAYANACLIAVAPELLSELIRLRNIVASYKQDSGDNLDITDAVIAKALGQQ
ncbi:hypothetical protein [Providencia rettgeri]|uniref:hypothetical protein n=1 Tax=Providencia rettgeri TaxID=587 RepID=UPI0025A6E092|nr:hypothetical protein [Providencia rettgeri]ELR5224213.1 hypothetical protein [Providencia rettgeri]MDX7324343.1 hypothetical protein [Providencia rettgeri]